MKISFLYSCAVVILYCKVLKAHVCAECCQEKCQLLSMTDNLILLDPGLGEKFGSLYFKIKNGSDSISKTDCLRVKKKGVWTCDSNTHDWCRKCKKEYCKQQICGDFCGFIHADAFYPFETFEHYMKNSYDRRPEFGSSNLTSDFHNECCKRRTCGSAEYYTTGERMHEKEPSDKLLHSLELSLMISFIATVASLSSMLFMFSIWSYSHLKRDVPSHKHEHTTQIPSNGLRSQRQKRRNRQKKSLNKASKPTDNNSAEKNVNGSSNKSNNEATKQNMNKESKPEDIKVSEQSENCKVLLSTNREIISTVSSVICVSQSQQDENSATGSENEWCTSATRVKQYKFSHEAKHLSQKEIIETEDCSEHSNKSIENERKVSQLLPFLEDLFENDDLLLDSESSDKTVATEVLPSLNLMTDFDQEQNLSYLKLPDPSIHDTEETFPKGSHNVQNGCRLFHREQYTYTTGYPFNTVSTAPLTRICSSVITSREDEGLSEYEYTKEVEVERKHLNVRISSFENYACSENEEKDCEINEYSEKQVPGKDEFKDDCTDKKEQMNQASDRKNVILYSEHYLKGNEKNDKNGELQENDSAVEQIGLWNTAEKVNTVSDAEKAEILEADDSESCNFEGSYLINFESCTNIDEISQVVDHDDHQLCQANIESLPSDSGASGHKSETQRNGNAAATNILSKETGATEVIVHSGSSGLDSTNKVDKISDAIMSDDCKNVEQKVEEISCTENKGNPIRLNNVLHTSVQVDEMFTFAKEDVKEKPFRKIYSSKQRKSSLRRRNIYKKGGKNMSGNRLCKCQRESCNCFEQENENRCLSFSQTGSTTQVGGTVPFTSIDSCSNSQQSYSANDNVKVNARNEECSHQHKSASDKNVCEKHIRVIHCSGTYVSQDRFKLKPKAQNRKRHFKGLAKRSNKSSNERSLDTLDMPSAINDRKENGKKRYCKVCHKLNVLCKTHRRTQNPYPKYRNFTRQCRTRFESTKSRNNHTKREENKLGKTEEVVSLVCQDSGFNSGNFTELDFEPTKFPTFCGQSSAKQIHECLLKEIKSEKLSFDSFQQLKVLQNNIEDVERQLLAKEISRELHIEHRNFTIFGLDSYFDRFNNGPPPTIRERMQYEWIRLASFHNYTGNGNALALARHGFYHDHNEGPMSTRCYLCEARRSDWEMLDDISAEHRRQSPNCPFHDNREEESMNISITCGDNSDTPARSSPSRAVTSSVTSSSSTSTVAAAVREVSSSFQGINITETRVGNSGGESISHQPTEDPESRDRSLLALSQPRTQRALGRTGYSYSTIIAPRRNNVATGAISNVGIDPLNSGSSSLGTGSRLPSTRPSSILGGPVGAGAFSGLRTAGSNTGALTSVSRATEGFQQSNATSTSTEARQTNPAPGAGGRTDPTITVVVDNPKHPDYVNIDSRVSSYQGWPDYLDQTPRQMSEAGFFYVGVADFTRCYCCGGGLRNWEPGDDPMLEHTRWFPRCEYVNKLKGERYVAAVQRRHQEHMAEQQRQQIEIAQRRDENRNPPDPMTTEAAAVMREMGYSVDRTKEAILAVRRQTGSSMVTTQQVLTWLLDDEERRLTGNSSNTELGIRPPPTSTATSLVGTSTPSSVVNTGTSIPSSIVHTGTSIGTSIVNTTSSISTATTIVSAGTATSTVSSSSASIAAEVQQSATSASVTAGGNSSASQNHHTGSGNSSSSNSASRTSIEKQSGASGDASEESKSTAKEDAATAKTTKKKNAKKKAKNKAGAKSETTGATGGDFDAKSLKAENEKLREMQTCKICMERAVNTTLLPCGHLVCCDTCAARLQRCPICRKRIKGTVKTFMS